MAHHVADVYALVAYVTGGISGANLWCVQLVQATLITIRSGGWPHMI